MAKKFLSLLCVALISVAFVGCETADTDGDAVVAPVTETPAVDGDVDAVDVDSDGDADAVVTEGAAE